MARPPDADAVRVGCAGWAVPAGDAAAFPGPGSHLERYARVLEVVEINTTFHRSHRRTSYERWAASVPAAFRFSAKVPKAITHAGRLIGVDDALRRFLGEVAYLGEKLGPLLVQLPPSLTFDPHVAPAFFESLRRLHAGPVACEPRHATWFRPEVEAVLADQRVARVAADPAPVPGAWRPGGLARPRLLPPARLAAALPLLLRPGLPRLAPHAARRSPRGDRGLVRLRQHRSGRGDGQRARLARQPRPGTAAGVIASRQVRESR